MIRYFQTEADVIRSTNWRRRRHIREAAARLDQHSSGPPRCEHTVRPVADAIRTQNRTSPKKKKALSTGPVPMKGNIPIILKLVERIAHGTDPLRDLAIVNILKGMGGKPSGPKTVLLVGDLADLIVDGWIHLDHGNPPHRRRTRGWEAPIFFGAVRRLLIDGIRAAHGTTGISPDELVCTMAQALRVPNTDSANIRFINAVWTFRPNANLGDRPTARKLTAMRAAFRRRNVVEASKPPHTAGGTVA